MPIAETSDWSHVFQSTITQHARHIWRWCVIDNVNGPQHWHHLGWMFTTTPLHKR
jgi:hypothetical protein